MEKNHKKFAKSLIFCTKLKYYSIHLSTFLKFMALNIYVLHIKCSPNIKTQYYTKNTTCSTSKYNAMSRLSIYDFSENLKPDFFFHKKSPVKLSAAL